MSILLKVLIVDDEALIRKGLVARLNALRVGMETREAKNGLQALEILETWQAQLVITDIQMPGMDGLDLITRVKESRPDTQFIILTGYAEFAYAQRALRLGVQEYLLKPISTAELAATIERTTSRIGSDSVEQNRNVVITHLQSSLSSIREQQSFYRLIDNASLKTSEAIALQKQAFPEWNAPLLLALLYVAGAAKVGAGVAFRPLRDVVAELLPESEDGGAPFLFAHHANPSKLVYLVFPCPLSCGTDNAVAALTCLLERLTAQGLSATAGISDAAYVLTHDMSDAAAVALQRRLLYGAGKVYVSGAESSRQTSRQLSQDLNDFRAALLISDSASAEATLMRIFSPEHVKDAPRNYLWTAYLHVMSTLSLNVELKGVDPDASPLNRFDSREEFIQYLHMLLQSVTTSRGISGVERNERIQHAIGYIRTHFHENLSLNSLSSQYDLSPNYFSTVFKKTMGMGVIDYLTKVRVENACYMLAHTEVSVGNIAHQVGYADAQYFFQVFKKNVGVTPVQYRKQHAPED